MDKRETYCSEDVEITSHIEFNLHVLRTLDDILAQLKEINEREKDRDDWI